MRRDVIRGTLINRAGLAPDASTIAEATLASWHQMSVRLTPVIGSRGFYVLFSRALHLTSPAFPWLAIAGDDGDAAALFANFRVCLKAQEAASALEASFTLLVKFTELLESLIGESLTERLLDPVWPPSPSVSEQENAP